MDFSWAEFGKVVAFNKAQFGDGSVSFAYAQFGHDNVDFSSVQFGHGNVDFSSAKFGHGNVYFNYAQFGHGNVSFNFTQFGHGNVDFSNSSAQRISFFRYTFSSHVNLRFKKIDELVLWECIIEKTLKCDNHGAYKTLSFKETINLGQIYIDWKNNNVYKAINDDNHTSEQKTAQFRMLKENFHNIGYYEDEDCAYKAYIDCKTKSLSWFLEAFKEGKQKNLLKGICKGIASVFKKLFYKAFGLISGYGTKPLRILGCAVVSIILCGFAYSPFVSESYSFMSICKGLYFSTITFLTIGYENMKPLSEFPAILSGIEGFLGLFLMSFFTVAVARKLLR